MPDRQELVTRDDLRRAIAVNALTKPLNVLVPAGVVVAGVVLGVVWLYVVAVVVYLGLAALTFFDGQEAERVGARAYGGARGGGRGIGAGGGAARVDPGTLSQPIGLRLDSALRAEAAIRVAITDSGLPLTDVAAEVDELVRAMERIAQRADRVHSYLETQDQAGLERRVSQLRAQGAMGGGAGGGGADAGAGVGGGAMGVGDDVDVDARSRTLAALEQQVTINGQLRSQLGRFYDEMEHLTASLGAINAQIVSLGVAGEDAEQAELAGQVRGLRESVNAIADGLKDAYARTDAPA